MRGKTAHPNHYILRPEKRQMHISPRCPRLPDSKIRPWEPRKKEIPHQEILIQPVRICRALAVGGSNQTGFVTAHIIPVPETRRTCRWNGVNGADSLTSGIRVPGSDFRRSLKSYEFPDVMGSCSFLFSSLGILLYQDILVHVTPKRMNHSMSLIEPEMPDPVAALDAGD